MGFDFQGRNIPHTMQGEGDIAKLPHKLSVAQCPVFGCSRRGVVHVHKNKPCQDAWATDRISAPPRDALVLAVADGHGASIHDKSAVGSVLATRAAVQEMSTLVDELGDDADSLEKLDAAFRMEFPKRVVERWRRLIREDALKNMPDQVDVGAKDLTPLYHRYGSTLLTALVLQEKIIVSSIGDGDVLLVRPNGEVALHQEQDAPELVGAMTFSLASHDPQLLFQRGVLPREDGGILILCTDGMKNSFVNDTYFKAFAVGLQEHIKQNGMDSVREAVPAWLDYFSAHGSGDDITLVLAWLEDELPANASSCEILAGKLNRCAGRRLGVRGPAVLSGQRHHPPIEQLVREKGPVRRRLYASSIDYLGKLKH